MTDCIPLGDLVARFEDGISLSAYDRIGRLIRKHGPLATLELILGNDADENQRTLHKVLLIAEKTGKHLKSH